IQPQSTADHEKSNGQEPRVAAPVTEVIFATGEDQANQNDCHESDNDECCPRRWFQLFGLPLLHVSEGVPNSHARANQMSNQSGKWSCRIEISAANQDGKRMLNT